MRQFRGGSLIQHTLFTFYERGLFWGNVPCYSSRIFGDDTFVASELIKRQHLYSGTFPKILAPKEYALQRQEDTSRRSTKTLNCMVFPLCSQQQTYSLLLSHHFRSILLIPLILLPYLFQQTKLLVTGKFGLCGPISSQISC